MTGTTMVITASALAGKFLATDQRLATLPVAMQFVLTMASTVPASFLMRRTGRIWPGLLAPALMMSSLDCPKSL